MPYSGIVAMYRSLKKKGRRSGPKSREKSINDSFPTLNAQCLIKAKTVPNYGELLNFRITDVMLDLND